MLGRHCTNVISQIELQTIQTICPVKVQQQVLISQIPTSNQRSSTQHHDITLVNSAFYSHTSNILLLLLI